MRKGFTTVELMIMLVIIGFLAVGASSIYQSNKNGVEASSGKVKLLLVKEKIMKLSDGSSIPESLSGMESVQDTTVTQSASESLSVVSYHRTDPTSMVLAVKTGEKCLLLAFSIEGKDGWAYSQNSCNASAYTNSSINCFKDSPGATS